VNHCQKPNTQKRVFAMCGGFASAVFSVYVCACVRVCTLEWQGEREEVWQDKHQQ